MRCPDPYGYRFITVMVASVRSSTSASASSVALTRLQITQPASLSASRPDTYDERQSAHSRSRLTRLPVLEHDRGQTGDEVVDAHVALRLLAPPLVHADGAVLDIGVAHDEDVRDLLGLGPPDASAELAARPVDHLRAISLGAEPVDEAQRVGVVPVAHGKHGDLHRREPRGERARVVLEQDREEAFDGPEQRPVNHHRTVPLVVGADV